MLTILVSCTNSIVDIYHLAFFTPIIANYLMNGKIRNLIIQIDMQLYNCHSVAQNWNISPSLLALFLIMVLYTGWYHVNIRISIHYPFSMKVIDLFTGNLLNTIKLVV